MVVRNMDGLSDSENGMDGEVVVRGENGDGDEEEEEEDNDSDKEVISILISSLPRRGRGTAASPSSCGGQATNLSGWDEKLLSNICGPISYY